MNSVQCTDEGCNTWGKRKYNSSLSESYRSEGLAFSYRTEEWGKVVGHTSNDRVSIGDLVLKEQNFGEVDHVSWELTSSWFEGVLGLGLPSPSGRDRVSVIQNLFDQGLLDDPIFCLYLAEGNMTTDSELILGGVDDALFTPPLITLQISDQAVRWESRLEKLQFGQDVFEPENELPIVFDSMSDIIWLPSNLQAYL